MIHARPFLSLVFVAITVTLLLSKSTHASVLVIGATGRTGSLLYKELKERGVARVRGLVRDVDKARNVLGCDVCGESEGIFVGDVTNITTLLPALRHVRTVAIASGVSGFVNMTTEEIKSVEFLGVQNAVRALAQPENLERFGLPRLKVVLCSSMGTTSVSKSHSMFSDILFYKLNAEAFLGSVGMTTAVVKPCGLVNDAGHNRTLLALHDDAPTPTGSRRVPREDVARVMAELAVRPSRQNLRFDLCSIEGPSTENLGELLGSARWEWEEVGVAARGAIDQLAQLFFHHPFGRQR